MSEEDRAAKALEKLYRAVPAAAREELRTFRETHPHRTALVKGTEWRYILAGEGEPILLLPGSSCVAEVGWRTIQGLEEAGFRVISPDYPAIRSNAELAAGILGLLDREGVKKAHVMGGSSGGLVAQYLVRHHPARVTSLILSHTIVPKRETGLGLARLLVLLRRLPERYSRWFVTAEMRRLFPLGRHPPAVALAWAHFREAVQTRVTKAHVVALLERNAELAVTQDLGPVDPVTWPGRVLLIISEDDPATPVATRQAIMNLFPSATVRRFHGTGHLTAVLEPDRFVAAVEEFVRPPVP
jgi:pimeloyl-ACP methyl ester carboxylesterase